MASGQLRSTESEVAKMIHWAALSNQWSWLCNPGQTGWGGNGWNSAWTEWGQWRGRIFFWIICSFVIVLSTGNESMKCY